MSPEILFDLSPAGSGFLTESDLVEMLPHGSGIDCKWRIEPRKDGVECFNSFHFMNENGSYDGWGDFSVRLFHHSKDVLNPLRGPCEGQTQVVHRKGDVDFKIVTRGSAWRRNVAFGLADYIHESVYFSLEKILTKRNETIGTAKEVLMRQPTEATPAALALEFSRQLRAALTPEQMTEVVKRNLSYGPNVCASHDFIDANEVMAAAFLTVTGRAIDLQSAADSTLWSDAWEHAKATQFVTEVQS